MLDITWKQWTEQAEQDAIAHAQREFPYESAGLMCGGNYRALHNAHSNPQNDFFVTPEEYLSTVKQHGPVQAVIHSHPFLGGIVPRLYPSAADMRSQLDHAVPWGIVCCDAHRSWPVQYFGDKIPILPLEKRPYIHGIYDCYSIIRDYYRLHYDMCIKEFPRDWAWWAKKGDEKQDLYEDGIAEAGFVPIAMSQLRAGDVVLAVVGNAATRTNTINHGGVYLGDGLLLHHNSGDSPYDPHRLSAVVPVGRYQKYMRYFLRHKDLI